MIASARPMRLATNDECAAYLHEKARSWANSAGKRGITAADASQISRVLRAAAEEIKQGFHLEGDEK